MRMTRREFVGGAAALAASSTGRIWAADKPAMAGIATTGAHVRQVIDGFGFSEAFHMARAIRNLEDKEQTDLLNLMFSVNGGMGYSMLRNEIGEGPADAGKTDGTVASIEPALNEFNWAGDEDQIWLTGEAKKRGCTRLLASAWSPPAWMKTNNSNWDGELKPAMYQAFADYLAMYVLEYKKRYGIDVTALSPANEPNFTPKEKYASCRWTGSQMTKFLRENLIPTFAAKGITSEIVINENEHWSDEMINEVLGDSMCAKHLNVVASHAYAPTTGPYMALNLRTAPSFNTALGMGKRVWQTEVSAGDTNITNMNDGVYWARVIHEHMIQDNVSAWLYWWGAASTKARSSLIAIDPATKKYQLSKRFFTIGHFARFIRPGFHRVDASPNPAPNTYFSAYLDPSGKQLVCVAINDDAVEHPLVIASDFKATICNAVRTSNTETHTRLPKVEPVNGQFQVTTAPLSVTTFVLT
jgi:glucuronoarabinoxylan endo-1,4-beta-xylanase